MNGGRIELCVYKTFCSENALVYKFIWASISLGAYGLNNTPLSQKTKRPTIQIISLKFLVRQFINDYSVDNL